MADSAPEPPRLYRPGPPLSRHVDYLGFWRSGDVRVRDRALPRGAATLIVDLGSPRPLDLYAADGTTRLDVDGAFVIGPHATSYVSDIAPGTAFLAVHFTPGGLRAFCGVAAHQLAHDNVSVESIWASDGRRLQERLREVSSMGRRVELVEEFLLAQARFPTSRHPEVAHAMSAFERDDAVRVAEVSRQAGVSQKRLIALFRNEIGLTPKAYARVRRFRAALRALRPDLSGAEIATATGYFDQAHFIREFRSFAALTPSQYLRSPAHLPGHASVDGKEYPIPAGALAAR